MKFQWNIANVSGLMFWCAMLINGCSNHKNDTHVRWHPTSEENARDICQNRNATGCVQMDNKGGCTIISPHMPMQEFTGDSRTMTSPLWMKLVHEFMHCLGYDHVEPHDNVPTPK